MSIRVKEFNNQLENNDVFKSIFMKLDNFSIQIL